MSGMEQRRYLPTFSELVDRLSIVQLKSIFIPSNKVAYDKEIADILHDLDLIVKEQDVKLTSTMIHAFLMIMLTNRYIWENESKAREASDSQNTLLKLTHSINGVRNTAKNVVSQELGERVDLKIDALAAELTAEFGNWDVWHKASKIELPPRSLPSTVNQPKVPTT